MNNKKHLDMIIDKESMTVYNSIEDAEEMVNLLNIELHSKMDMLDRIRRVVRDNMINDNQKVALIDLILIGN